MAKSKEERRADEKILGYLTRVKKEVTRGTRTLEQRELLEVALRGFIAGTLESVKLIESDQAKPLAMNELVEDMGLPERMLAKLQTRGIRYVGELYGVGWEGLYENPADTTALLDEVEKILILRYELPSLGRDPVVELGWQPCYWEHDSFLAALSMKRSNVFAEGTPDFEEVLAKTKPRYAGQVLRARPIAERGFSWQLDQRFLRMLKSTTNSQDIWAGAILPPDWKPGDGKETRRSTPSLVEDPIVDPEGAKRKLLTPVAELGFTPRTSNELAKRGILYFHEALALTFGSWHDGPTGNKKKIQIEIREYLAIMDLPQGISPATIKKLLES